MTAFCLYIPVLNGIKKNEKIQGYRELITNVVKGIDPYKNFNDYLALAKKKIFSSAPNTR